MRHPARLLALALAVGGGLVACSGARAVSPRNPYRSFNLSGINYGSMQWERAQQHTRSWTSATPAARNDGRGGTVTAGGFAGAGRGAAIQRSGPHRRGLFRRR